MKKKYIKLIKIFLAVIMVFSQLSNATVVFANEILDTDITLNNDENNDNIVNDDGVQVDEPSNDEETNVNDEDKDNDIEPAIDEDSDKEENLDEIDDNTLEENFDEEENNKENEPTESDSKDEFNSDDLKAILDAYLNKSELSEEIINLLIQKGAPSTLEGEFTEITFDDIMFVNELLKENSDTESEREDNSNLKLLLGDTPVEVTIGDTFEVKVLISNEEIVGENEESSEDVISDFIDGIEGVITTNDNLKLIDVSFDTFEGAFNEEGMFAACGGEYGDDNGNILTLTFEAILEGVGEVTISGKTAKYLNITDFENLTFSTTVIPKEEEGLISIISDVGEFDKEFNKDVLEYTLTVPYDTNEVTLSGALASTLSNVEGLSSYTLEGDKTEVLVTVTNSDGTTTVYKINIIREAKEEEQVMEVSVVNDTPVVAPIVYYVYSSNNYLKSLNIKDYDLSFDKDTLEYKIKVKSDVSSLEITAIPADYRSRVEISGNENFEEGKNTVTIKVTAENGDVREYKLIVDKAVKETVEEEEDSSNVEKIIIIILIILVVLGLVYLIFKKDDGEMSKEDKESPNKDFRNNNSNYNSRKNDKTKEDHDKKNKKER